MKISLPLIFLDKVKIIPANNDGPVHLSTMACSSYDATPDGHSASEWAFLINVGSCNKEQIKDTQTTVGLTFNRVDKKTKHLEQSNKATTIIVVTAVWRGTMTHHLHTFIAPMARGVATPYTHRRGEYTHHRLGY